MHKVPRSYVQCAEIRPEPTPITARTHTPHPTRKPARALAPKMELQRKQELEPALLHAVTTTRGPRQLPGAAHAPHHDQAHVRTAAADRKKKEKKK